VGTLAEKDNRLFFEYDPGWLARGLELSPFSLPLQPGLIRHEDLRFGPLFGLFDDSLPDGWGLLLMDRAFRAKGIDPATVSPLDRLLYLGTRTMGALTYHPPADRSTPDRAIIDLQELAREAAQVYAGKSKDILPLLMRAGGSPGGARPKVVVGFNPGNKQMVSGEDDLPAGFEHWLVKFPAGKDMADEGPVEYAYSLMAGAAGIAMPETRLFAAGEGGRFFGVKRFDRRPGNRRLHVQRFSSLIHVNFRIPACDYGDLLKATSLLTRNHPELERVFRLMVFNVLAHNRDDHAGNFAFLLDDLSGEWSFAPAYDLTFASGPGGEHTTTVLGEGERPSRQQCVRLGGQYGITPARAEVIFAEVAAAVSRWHEFAERAGVGEESRKRVGRYLAGGE
jgi:serine/threonine-protein kinase HipA